MFWTPNTRTRILPLILAGHALALGGCLKSSSPAAVSALPDLLTLSGTVTGPSGKPEQGVQIYVETAPVAAAVSDSSGAYQFTLDHDALLQITSALAPGQGGYHLYFERLSDPTVRGISTSIGTAERGPNTVAAVSMQAAATITGTVLAAAGGRQVAPSVATVVTFGRYKATTATDGTFKLANVPAGQLFVSATAAGFASALEDATPAAGQTLALPRPLVLFPALGINGIVQMQTPVPIAELIKAGHPFQRTFLPVGSLDAKFIRYGNSNDPKLFPAQPWMALSGSFDFDFPANGGNVLYYQFADASQTTLSPINQLTVILDEFAQSLGVTIGDGSGLVTTRDTTVKVDVPAAAFRMMVGESLAEIGQPVDPKDPPTGWVDPAPTFNHTFTLPPRDNNGNSPNFGERTIYVVFEDASNPPNYSPVYSATVLVNLYPATTTPVLTLAGGATSTPDRLVRADIQVPANATEMQLFDPATSSSGGSIFSSGSSGGTQNLWMPVSPYVFYTFTKDGLHTLYLQFRTVDMVLSSNYMQSILVQPFPPAPVGFQINGGALLSLTPNLDIELVPPPMAQQFQVYEASSGSSGGGLSSIFGGGSSGGASSAPMLSLMSHYTYTVTTPGVHTIYVDYIDVYGQTSAVYAQTIDVQPFPPPTGQFFIDNGAVSTWSPELTLSISPPQTATQMAFAENLAPDAASGNWIDVAPMGTFVLATEATVTVLGTTVPLPPMRTIFARFKSADGIVSDAVQVNIVYNPFPDGGQGITINNGALTTPTSLVQLGFWGNPNITQMRVASTLDGLASATFQQVLGTLAYTLPGLGTQRVYAQFQTLVGEISPAYFATIINNQPVSTGTTTSTSTATSTGTGSTTGTGWTTGTDSGSATATGSMTGTGSTTATGSATSTGTGSAPATSTGTGTGP